MFLLNYFTCVSIIILLIVYFKIKIVIYIYILRFERNISIIISIEKNRTIDNQYEIISRK